MKKNKCIAGLFICIAMMFSGCVNSGSYVTKEYELPTETVALTQEDINLEDYRIQEGAMISLGELINIKGMVLESVCFYDKNNLVTIFLNEEGTRIDAYMFSLEKGTLNWLGTIENLTNIEGIYSSYSIVSVEPLVIMDEYTNNIWVLKDKMVQQKISLDLSNVYSIAIGNNKAYYTHVSNNAIESIDFTSGQVDTIYTGLEEYSYSISKVTQVSDDGKYLYAVGINKLGVTDTTFVIDLNQKKVVAEVCGIYECYNSDNYMYSVAKDSQTYTIHQRTDNNYTEVTVGELVPYNYFEYFVSDINIQYSFSEARRRKCKSVVSRH